MKPSENKQQIANNTRLKIAGEYKKCIPFIPFAEKKLVDMLKILEVVPSEHGYYLSKTFYIKDIIIKIKISGFYYYIEIYNAVVTPGETCPLIYNGLLREFIIVDNEGSQHLDFFKKYGVNGTSEDLWIDIPLTKTLNPDIALSTGLNSSKYQYEDVKPMNYTGYMSYIMQNSMGSDLENKFNFSFHDSDGIIIPPKNSMEAEFSSKINLSDSILIKVSQSGVFVRDNELCKVDNGLPYNTPDNIALNSFFKRMSFVKENLQEDGILQLIDNSGMNAFYSGNPLYKAQGWVFKTDLDSIYTNISSNVVNEGDYYDFYYSIYNTCVSGNSSSLYCIRLIVRYIAVLENSELVIKRLFTADLNLVKTGIANINGTRTLIDESSLDNNTDIAVSDDNDIECLAIKNCNNLSSEQSSDDTKNCPIYVYEENINELRQKRISLIVSNPVDAINDTLFDPNRGERIELNDIEKNILKATENIETIIYPDEPNFTQVSIPRTFFLSNLQLTSIIIENSNVNFNISINGVSGGVIKRQIKFSTDHPFLYDEGGNMNTGPDASIVEPGSVYNSVELIVTGCDRKFSIPRGHRNFIMILSRRLYTQQYDNSISVYEKDYSTGEINTIYNYKTGNGALISSQDGIPTGVYGEPFFTQKIKTYSRSNIYFFNSRNIVNIMNGSSSNNDLFFTQETFIQYDGSYYSNMFMLKHGVNLAASTKLTTLYTDLSINKDKITFIGLQGNRVYS